MDRRKLLSLITHGSALLTAGGTASQAQAKAGAERKSSKRERIAELHCEPHKRAQSPFSFIYLGVGTCILRAESQGRSVAVVVPTVGCHRLTSKRMLDLGRVPKVDELIVCVLHNHWDHRRHADLFLELLHDRDRGKATLARFPGDFTNYRSHAERFDNLYDIGHGELRGGTPQLRHTLRFVSQGPCWHGHAKHIGRGTDCSEQNPNCGSKLLKAPEQTYCLLGEFTIAEGRSFTFFVNDAASSGVAENVKNSGLVPPLIDLALIAIPNGHLAHGYPEQLVPKLNAQKLFWVHWEGFIIDPGHSRRRIRANGNRRKPWVGPEGALPRALVEETQKIAKGSCFPYHSFVHDFAGHAATSKGPKAQKIIR